MVHKWRGTIHKHNSSIMENKPSTVIPVTIGRNCIDDVGGERIIRKVSTFWTVSFVRGKKSFKLLNNFIPQVGSNHNYRNIKGTF